ncbi:hypothetical protein L202_07144 [Cryptococcus amylolentus CBS 6039]|uniref:Major facilitator superfamily (MFS) profile domain-containing protein n=1 Tax=Cryptococcus amylolentus CBS 6039 TaxID=1295533 RepID=A0A1E3HES1_9TREE|nr:hypothetical protein L202_07144 [Cryptococcus amylolentus CBS 6039]ODN74838.1 hypothetical protein L202_07144 [Cryptococcus amylolentus CBS 6039]
MDEDASGTWNTGCVIIHDHKRIRDKALAYFGHAGSSLPICRSRLLSMWPAPIRMVLHQAGFSYGNHVCRYWSVLSSTTSIIANNVSFRAFDFPGVGGCVFPFIMSGLLNGVGYKKAMIILGAGFGVLGLICLLPINRRVPVTKAPVNEHGRKVKFDWSFLKSGLLWISLSIILFTSMGNFIPSLWLPTYANDLNLTHPNGTALLSILNAASVPGNALLGYMSDRFSMRTTILTSCLGSGLAVAFLWGFGKSEGVVVLFCLVFGLLGPSFSAVWTKINATVAKDNTQAFAYILSLFTFLRGIGSFSSGPVSEALLAKTSPMRGGVGGYGVENYGPVILYSAGMILGGGVAGAFFKERKVT